MREKMPYNVFIEKREKGWVLIQMTGIKRTTSASRIWPKALIAPRKPMIFKTHEEAKNFALGKNV